MKAMSFVLAACLFSSSGIAYAAPEQQRGDVHAAEGQTEDVHFSVKETVIELLIDDPRAKAVLDKHLPGLSSSDTIGLAGGLTLEDLQKFIPAFITVEKLAAIQDDFDKF